MIENLEESNLDKANQVMTVLLSEIKSEMPKEVSYRFITCKNSLNRFILFKKNSNVRDVVEISLDNSLIRWNGKTVSRTDFVLNYLK